MIQQFEKIKHLAVFEDFKWGDCVLDADNNPILFNDINILYGRNYSGKTTLSRLVDALDRGSLPKGYDNAECSIEIKDGYRVTHADYLSHSKTVRVFNKDYVLKKLAFIYDPDSSVEPFAVFGEDIVEIEKKLSKLEAVRGDVETNTGLFKDLKNAQILESKEKATLTQFEDGLYELKRKKALDRNTGIKDNADKFGDIRYTVKKLDFDIQTVLKKSYKQPSTKEIAQLEHSLSEQRKDNIPPLSRHSLGLSSLLLESKELIERKVGDKDKIEELVRDKILNKWVGEGLVLQKNKRTDCAFCDNPISDTRWEELEKHFDKESEELKKAIAKLIVKIEGEEKRVSQTNGLKKENFYSKYHDNLDALITEYESEISKYGSALGDMKNQLQKKKDSVLQEVTFNQPEDNSQNIDNIYDSLDKLISSTNAYSTQLLEAQTDSKNQLRLNEVRSFVDTINYEKELKKIANAEKKVTAESGKVGVIQTSIDEIEKEINDLRVQTKDEEIASREVNNLLENCFGEVRIEIKPIEIEDGEEKSTRFHVYRDGEIASNLSEGESSVLAFCYFVSRLKDVQTKGKKPIIWIDDPITSLDGNHVFYIYSLIRTEILDSQDFEQIFISTHSLDFLKYLKRLKCVDKAKSFFMVQRKGKFSEIRPMPKYMKEYVTEFNFLFEQIHLCATVTDINSENYQVFYNFGNNARKFLELICYFKYPYIGKDIDKMKMFFDGEVPAIIAERVNNEYSHLSGVLERGGSVVDEPEMQTTAKRILERLEILDETQYQYLLKSIGVEE